MMGAPSPRFRLYTDAGRYLAAFAELAAGRVQRRPESVAELERRLALETGSRFVLCTSTARTAIYLTLAAVIKPGQKVLLSPLTIVDVVNMVLCAGGRPVFLDVEENTCNVDAAEVERNIDGDTGAVLVTHLHGLACDVERIKAACDRRGVPLIEDAAQAFSTKVGGRPAGTFGTAGIYSFGLYKNVNAFYGGAIATSDEGLHRALQERVRGLPPTEIGHLYKRILFGLATDVATSPIPFSLFTYWLFRYGQLNGISAITDMVTVDRYPRRFEEMPERLLRRMTPLQARLIAGQLGRVEAHNRARIEAAKRYHEGLSGLPGVVLPPLRTDGSHIYTYYPIRVPDRIALNRFALRRRRDFVLSHYHNCASLAIFKEHFRDCPRAQRTSEQLIYLPTYPGYPGPELEKNIQAVRDFIEGRGA